MSATISRRSIAKGTAWSIPVLAVGTAARAYAGSCPPASANATLTGASNYSANNGAITWTNSGPDTIPAGTVWTAYIYVTATATGSGTGIGAYAYPDSTHDLAVTVTPGSSAYGTDVSVEGDNPVTITQSAPHGATKVLISLTQDLAPDSSVTSNWSTSLKIVTLASTSSSSGMIAHPMGGSSSSASSTVHTVGYVPTDETSTSTATDKDTGCPTDVTLTVDAFNTNYAS